MPTLPEKYIASRDLRPASAYQLTLSVRRFADWLGRQPKAADWTADTINRFLTAYTEGRSKNTVKGVRNNLVTIFRFAVASKIVKGEPGQVKRIKAPRTLPEAWSKEEVRRLLRASEQFLGETGQGVNRRAMLRALWLTCYDSALRRGDLMDLEREQIGSDGSLVLVQHKTGDVILCKLRPETMAAIDATFPPARKTIFGDACGPRQMYELCVACIQKAGLKGGLQKMRRTSATLLEQICPGAAMKHLGHRTPGLAYRNYVDPRFVQEQKPLPPPIQDVG